MFLLAIYYLSVTACVTSLDPFMFEVKNANKTILYLKQFDYGRKSINWTLDILSKLDIWERQISKNPLLFENPATNFLLLKMLRMDIQQEMIPSYLKEQFKRSVKIPSKQELRKSAIILNDMMAMYGFSTHQGVAIIYG